MNIKDLFYQLTLPHIHKGYSFSVVEQMPEEDCLISDRVYVVINPLKKEGAYSFSFVPPYRYRVRLQIWSLSAALSDEIANYLMLKLGVRCHRYWQTSDVFINPAVMDSTLRAWVAIAQIEGIANN